MKAQVIERAVFLLASPGIGVSALTFYTSAENLTLKCLHTRATRSDTVDSGFERDSFDNGRTWSESRQLVTNRKQEDGVWRRNPYPGYLDPGTGKLLMLRLEGLLRDDDPLQDGIRNWHLSYAVSLDGGQTYDWDEQIIEEGTEYFDCHPVAGNWVGKNSLMLGAVSETPCTLRDGTILVPCQLAPVDDAGELLNPGGGYTYQESMVLRGTWQADGKLQWRSSARVQPDPSRTTRGLLEPVIAELPDGRVLMVMRGSNDMEGKLPGYKWHVFSGDGGQTWSTPAPWTYEDGEAFFSPSSCSQLLPHSNGKLFWLGNVSPENPRGNGPRYPLVVGEVDQGSGLLLRDSVAVIDTRQEGESQRLQLSNFYAREDRESGEIVLHCTRLFANQQPEPPLDWTSDAMIYRIAV